MSHEVKKQSIKTGVKLYELTDTQRIDKELVLPDYCREIKKLLRCSFTPGIHTVSLSGERVTAKGTGMLRAVYLGEGDVIDCFEKSCDISCFVQMKDLPSSATVTANQRVDFLNCRVTGKRKLSVDSGISTVFVCRDTKPEELVSDAAEGSVMMKKEKLTAEDLKGYFEKTFDLSETLVFAQEHPSAEKIVSCDGSCFLESKKLSAGKLLLKGEAKIDLIYLPEKTQNKLHSLTHLMPISQIVDIGEDYDGADCDIKLENKQLLCTLKADSSGSNRLADLSMRVSAFITVSEKKELEAVTDCYCTDYEEEADYAYPEFYCPLREVNEALEHKGEIEFSFAVKEILSVKCLEITESLSCSEDKATVSCNALLGIIFLDEKGLPSYCEKNSQFEFSYAIVKKCKDPFVAFDVRVNSLSCSLSGNDRAQITLGYTVKGKIYCNHDKKVLRGLTVLKDKPKKDKGAALTLYFPS